MIKKNNIKFIDLGLPSENLWGDRNLGSRSRSGISFIGKYTSFDTWELNKHRYKFDLPMMNDFEELFCEAIKKEVKDDFLILEFKNKKNLVLPLAGKIDEFVVCIGKGFYWVKDEYKNNLFKSCANFYYYYNRFVAINEGYFSYRKMQIRPIKKNDKKE